MSTVEIPKKSPPGRGRGSVSLEALVLRLYKTDIFNNIAGFIESTTSNLP